MRIEDHNTLYDRARSDVLMRVPNVPVFEITAVVVGFLPILIVLAVVFLN